MPTLEGRSCARVSNGSTPNDDARRESVLIGRMTERVMRFMVARCLVCLVVDGFVGCWGNCPTVWVAEGGESWRIRFLDYWCNVTEGAKSLEVCQESEGDIMQQMALQKTIRRNSMCRRRQNLTEQQKCGSLHDIQEILSMIIRVDPRFLKYHKLLLGKKESTVAPSNISRHLSPTKRP